MHVPGIYVVFPATPADAKGLLKTAIRDPNPVIFLEHKKLYNVKGEVPDGEFLIPFGKARIAWPGKDATVVATGYMAHLAAQVAAELAKQDLSVEVIDPRTLTPLDMETILTSVRKTHKVAVIAEDTRRAGPTAEIAASISEACFEYLDAPVVRVGAKDSFIAHNVGMSEYVVPGSAQIEQAIRDVVYWS